MYFDRMDDETLNRLAVEAIMEEAKLGARRAEIMGPSGWMKPKESINKRFLNSTLRNVVLSNKYHVKRKERTKDKQLHKEENSIKYDTHNRINWGSADRFNKHNYK